MAEYTKEHVRRDVRRVEEAIRRTAQLRDRSALLVLVLAAALFPLLWTPWIHGNDGVRNYAYCRSFWLDFDVDFANEFTHYRRAGELEIKRVDAVTGLEGNALGVGSAVLWSPFFLAGHLLAWIGPARADGYSAPYAWAISFASTFYAVAGLLLLTRLLAWRFDGRAAFWATTLTWLGSPLVFYMYLHPSMSHACSFFLCTLTLWEYERWREAPRPRHFFLLGATAGLAAVTRFNNGVFLLVPLLFWARTVRLRTPVAGYGRLSPRLFAALLGLVALGVLAGAFPQLAAWRVFYDAWFAGPRDYDLGTNLSVFRSPHLGDVLLSGTRGLFVWAPVALLGLAGFLVQLRRGRAIDRTLLVMFVAQLWVVGGWSMWWGGASFGQRFFINFTPLFAIGLAFLLQRKAPARKFFIATGLACVLWTAGLAVQYVAAIVPREEPVAFRTLARNQITAAPEWALRRGLRLLVPGLRDAREAERPAETP